jgi:hypothetical protein
MLNQSTMMPGELEVVARFQAEKETDRSVARAAAKGLPPGSGELT